MIIQRSILLLLTLSISLIGCQSKLAKERETLHAEVIKIHDEVMPMIPDIRKNKSKMAELIKIASEAKDTVNQLKCEKAYYLLNQADDAMFGWMKQFGELNPSENVPNKKAVKILKEQKESASRMRDLMLRNVKEAGELMEN